VGTFCDVNSPGYQSSGVWVNPHTKMSWAKSLLDFNFLEEGLYVEIIGQKGGSQLADTLYVNIYWGEK
jgi:hypothetical protein